MVYSTKKASDFGKALNGWLPTEKEMAKIVSDTSYKEGQKIVKKIQSSPPYTNRTGKLNASNQVEKKGTSTIIFSNNAKSKKGFPYAIALHEGSGIYGITGKPITPVQAPYLKFFWHKMGRWVTAPSVKGVKPMKWFYKGWKDNLPTTLKSIFKEVNKQTRLKSK